MIAITIAFGIASLCTNADATPSQLKGGGSFRFPWKTASTPTSTSSLSTSSPRGGAAARARPVHKGSASSSAQVKKGPMKKKMKKRGTRNRKMSSVPQLPEESRSSTKRSSSAGAAAVKGDTMPSIFRIPSEEKYDRYSAALAVTEGLRRVRDAEIARAKESETKKNWLGSISSGDKGKPPQNPLEAAKKRAESAFLLQSTKAVKAMGMTVTQFNQIGREVTSDPALKERVSEQAYLYRMASVVNLEKVPLLEDPSSKKLLQSQEHKKFRVQLFARSIHELKTCVQTRWKPFDKRCK